MSRVIIDADSLFFDAFSLPDLPVSGFGPIRQVGQTFVPTEINDEIIDKGVRRAKKRIKEMGDRFWTGDLLIAVKGKDNFRYQIYPEYKSSRGQGVTLLRDLAGFAIEAAIDEGWAIPAHGMEADDLVRIWAEEARRDGADFVVSHIDKDLNAIPGLHFNYRQNVTYTIDEARARVLFYKQLLTGDSSDSIPGCKGIGKVKAERILGAATEEGELQERVVEAYMEVYEDKWQEQLQLNGSLLYLLQTRDDVFSIESWEIVQALKTW